MTVFILWYNNFHGDDEMQGIYSTKEEAENRINKWDKPVQKQLRVEEYILDSD